MPLDFGYNYNNENSAMFYFMSPQGMQKVMGSVKIVPHLQNCGAALVSKVSLQPALFKTHICLLFGEYNKYIHLLHKTYQICQKLPNTGLGLGEWGLRTLLQPVAILPSSFA